MVGKWLENGWKMVGKWLENGLRYDGPRAVFYLCVIRFTLETAVGLGSSVRFSGPWQGATTSQPAVSCKEAQSSPKGRKKCTRTCSALAQMVNLLKRESLNESSSYRS
jgi:hypothetical protein